MKRSVFLEVHCLGNSVLVAQPFLCFGDGKEYLRLALPSSIGRSFHISEPVSLIRFYAP